MFFQTPKKLHTNGPPLDINFFDFSQAARNGRIELVKWMIQRYPSLNTYTMSIAAAIDQDQKQTLEVILEMLAKEQPKMRMDVYTESLGSSFFSEGEIM